MTVPNRGDALVRCAVLALTLLLCTGVTTGQSSYFPPLAGPSWDTLSATSLGWRVDRLDTLYRFLDRQNSKAFIVLKDGRIVLERYFDSFTRDSNWYWASAGKTLTAFLVGMAQREGSLSLSDTSSRWLGRGWTSAPAAKERLITVRNQLTMTSGLDDRVPDPYCTLPSCLLYLADAGTRWAYHNAPYTLLDSVVEGATGQGYNQYFASRIRSRTGMNGLWLPSGYNNVYFSTPRSMARFGILVLNRGVWAADTLMRDTSYFRQMVNTSQQINLSYGYLWWLNGKASYMLPQTQFVFPGPLAPSAPPDMISALGKDGQILNVVPSMGLVMVRMGESPDSSGEVTTLFNNQIWRLFREVLPPTGVDHREAAVPDGVVLEQNFPNPFNPATVVRFSVRSQGRVRLAVFDALGREVAVLVDGTPGAGTHSVVWHATGMPSGVYFYRVTAGGSSEASKMLLLR